MTVFSDLMTEQEALEAFFAEWDRQANEYGASLTREQRDCAEEAWNAALAWLRSQGEPVGYAAKIAIDLFRNCPNNDSIGFRAAPIDGDVPLFLTSQPTIPDGYRLVPVEPTEEMSACIELSMASSNGDIYRAMLAAAPQPGEPT